MKKILSIVGIIILVLIVVVVLFLGQIVKTTIETVGPKVAGVEMKVEKARVYPLGVYCLTGNRTNPVFLLVG